MSDNLLYWAIPTLNGIYESYIFGKLTNKIICKHTGHFKFKMYNYIGTLSYFIVCAFSDGLARMIFSIAVVIRSILSDKFKLGFIDLVCVFAITLPRFWMNSIIYRIVPYNISADELKQTNNSKERQSTLQLLNCAVFSPITEEYLYRYYMEKKLPKYTSNSITKSVISSAIFSLSHYSPQYPNMVLYNILTSCFIGGSLYSLLYKVTGNIWTPIISHSLYNSVHLYKEKFFGAVILN